MMDMHDERREDLTQPGVAKNSPRDTDGTGPASLPDRTKPGGQGSPPTNQAKAEPMPAGPGSPTFEGGPTLDEISVGSAPSQAPRIPGLPPLLRPHPLAPRGLPVHLLSLGDAKHVPSVGRMADDGC